MFETHVAWYAVVQFSNKAKSDMEYKYADSTHMIIKLKVQQHKLVIIAHTCFAV